MKLVNLLKHTGIEISPILKNIEVDGLTYDSRNINANFVFVAISGFSSDGHDYVKKALDLGAAAVIVEKPMDEINSSLILLNPTGNNRDLLAEMSAVFYNTPWNEMKTVGITGTNGKTSTAHILRWILEKQNIQTGIMGTVGHIAGGRTIEASVTTPESLQVAEYMREMANSGDKAAVMEVSSHALSLSRVKKVRFDVTLFTNISQDHLDFHKDMEEYLETKKKIFSLVKKNGSRIVGTYASGWPDVADSITFGEREEDSFRITDIKVRTTGSSFTLWKQEKKYPVVIKAPGRFNVYNAVGAIACATELGVLISKAVEAVASFPGVPGRMESVDCGQDFLVSVDYAHTPDALERVIKQGSALKENRLIVVFGCGGDRDNRKRPIMGKIAVENADVVFVTSDNPRTENADLIIQDILAGISDSFSPVVEPDRAIAIKNAILMANAGDVVIIAGKGHEDYQILGRDKIHFDDREHCRMVLETRGYKCTH